MDATTLLPDCIVTGATDADFAAVTTYRPKRPDNAQQSAIDKMAEAHRKAGHTSFSWDASKSLGYAHDQVVRQLFDLPPLASTGKTDSCNLWFALHGDGFKFGLLNRSSAPGWEPDENGKDAFAIVHISPWLTHPELVARCSEPAVAVIDKILHKKKLTMLIAPPKAGKSLIGTEASVCITNKLPFWGLETTLGIVGYVDFEQDGFECHDRLTQIAKVRGIKPDWSRIKIWPVGEGLDKANVDIDRVCQELARRPERFIDLLVFDPLYAGIKEGVSENDNLAMAAEVRKLLHLAKQKNFALLICHHTPKGDASSKPVSDCAAGAGALSRMAHSFIVLREHEKEDHYIVDTLMRGQPLDSFVLRKQYPVLNMTDADPTQYRKKGQRPGLTTADFVAKYITTEPQAKGVIKAKAKGRVTEDLVSQILEDAERQHLLVKYKAGPAIMYVLPKEKK